MTLALDSRQHRPDAEYLRSLIAAAGISQRQAARLCGIGERKFRRYLTLYEDDFVPAPYAVQFCLEWLAASKRGAPIVQSESRR